MNSRIAKKVWYAPDGERKHRNYKRATVVRAGVIVHRLDRRTGKRVRTDRWGRHFYRMTCGHTGAKRDPHSPTCSTSQNMEGTT